MQNLLLAVSSILVLVLGFAGRTCYAQQAHPLPEGTSCLQVTQGTHDDAIGIYQWDFATGVFILDGDAGLTDIHTINLSNSNDGYWNLAFNGSASDFGRCFASNPLDLSSCLNQFWTDPATGQAYHIAVCGSSVCDPQFTGFQGQNYQVHGMPDEYFNLITSQQFQLNSKFVYLANGNCDYNNTACWTHPGTYHSQLGLMFRDTFSNKVDRIQLISRANQLGLTVFLNDIRLHVDSVPIHLASNTSSLTFDRYDRVTISTSQFKLSAVNADNFMNLDSALLDTELLKLGSRPAFAKTVPSSRRIHGLLGQTWVVNDHARVYEGSVEDYNLQDGIFGVSFPYNLF